ncbi:MAG: aminoglycoside phosphotransferase family protein [Lachnospiraceae bacterium]|nr:aminoglycoside phosphotransferase family protein [Lachnospiraceae bacterium]
MDLQNITRVAGLFSFDGEVTEAIPYGNGHINDTYRITCRSDEGVKRYILQRMNRNVFNRPEELMENLCSVTEWLKKKITENGGDAQRETLSLVPVRNGKPYLKDAGGEYWRAYLFIENATSYDLVEKDEDFYQSAVAFGRFQRLLADYPADTLHETIPDFHNTPDRLAKFEAALEADMCGRANKVQEEIYFILERRSLTHMLTDHLENGTLPLRVTHNDTKLNNVMIDDQSGKAICVIDLDTVMPGLSLYDFGDSIRFGASTAAEDEQDLSKVSCSLHLFELYAKGYIEGCAGALTDAELDLLPMGAIVMTFECGIRFLTDYLEGDHYFKIHREGHNLDRARTQFRLVSDMEEKLPQMEKIVRRLLP